MKILLTTTYNNENLIVLIIEFLWNNLFIVLTQFFCLSLILTMIRQFID